MSNLRPRPPLPPPASPAICRVQPLVPELSLFVPGHGAPPPPPQPHLPPTHHLLPQSDLSRQFHRSEATLFLSGSNSDILPRKVQWSDQQSETQNVATQYPASVSRPSSASQSPVTFSQPPSSVSQSPATVLPPSASFVQQTPPAGNRGGSQQPEWSSPVHPDILAVLNWQNDQLARLQDQVSRLLAASPAEVRASPTTNTRDVAVGSPILRRAATVSTNTSTAWPQVSDSQGVIHGGEMELVSQAETDTVSRETPVIAPSTEENISRRESLGSKVTPVKVLDVEKGATSRESLGNSVTPAKAGLDVGVAWESPVLGESVSMYERESQLGSEREEQEMYENILGKVRRLLAQGEPTAAPQEQKEVSIVEEKDETSNQTEATWERLKQLGVSFISPADLAPPATDQPYSSVWLPQARMPSLHNFSSTPDTSLAINNLALKYLSDKELAQLATLHNKKDKSGWKNLDMNI